MVAADLTIMGPAVLLHSCVLRGVCKVSATNLWFSRRSGHLPVLSLHVFTGQPLPHQDYTVCVVLDIALLLSMLCNMYITCTHKVEACLARLRFVCS